MKPFFKDSDIQHMLYFACVGSDQEGAMMLQSNLSTNTHHSATLDRKIFRAKTDPS